jgi:hypothetical protein
MLHIQIPTHPHDADMHNLEHVGLVVLAIVAAGPVVGASTVQEIVQRSVQNADADWAAAPQYAFTERDVITRHGKRTTRTYQVTMIEGSPYNKLIAVNDQQLPPAQAEEEESKFRQETDHRRKETTGERQKRVTKYQAERRQDHALMSEMMKAFDFKLRGEETVNGRRCFVLEATPRANYRPKDRDTKVLKGMRGEMWVDVEQYQWVKVHAEVFRPVAFGLFVAHVQPGTEFTLEQTPIQNNIWLPSHFSTRVKATVLLFSTGSNDDETYSNYRHADNQKSAQVSHKP